VRRAGGDTVRFELPAVARRCLGGRAVLLEGVDYKGNGVLVLLLAADSSQAPAAGAYPVTALVDSVTRPGANVAVRYMIRETAYGVALDRGSVDLTTSRRSYTARVTGAGVEAAAPVSLVAEFDRVSLGVDSVPCRYQR
jgi:hypothetical protein